MKCCIIRDLLPLYLDDICSEETKDIVGEHLKGCGECQKSYENMKSPLLPEEEDKKKRQEDGTVSEVDKAVKEFDPKQAFRKIRRRWIASLLIVALLVFQIPIIYLGVNQYRGMGPDFTNLDDIYYTRAALTALKKGNYKKAFSYIDIEKQYREKVEPLPEISGEEETYSIITIGKDQYYILENVKVNDYKFYMEDGKELEFWSSVLDKGGCIESDKYVELVEQGILETEPVPENSPIPFNYNDKEYYVFTGDFNIRQMLLDKQDQKQQASQETQDQGDIVSLSIFGWNGNGNQTGMGVVPADLYETNKRREEKEWREGREYTEKIRKAYMEMGYDAYYQESRKKFLSSLEELERNNIVISSISLDEVYRSSNGYNVKYKLYTEQNGIPGKEFSMSFLITGGKLYLSSGAYDPDDTSSTIARGILWKAYGSYGLETEELY